MSAQPHRDAKVRTGRRYPFFIVGKDATALIEQTFEGRRLPIARSVYFAIVELANDARSDSCQVPRKTLAQKAGVHVRVADEYLEELAKAGLLHVERRQVEGVNLPNIWTVADPEEVVHPASTTPAGGLPQGGASGMQEGGASSVHGGSARSTTPTDQEGLLPESEDGEEAREARAPSRMSYQGRQVPPQVLDDATTLLAVFNDATGRDLGAATAAGQPSPTLRQIVGAMLARPEVDRARWEAAVRKTVEDPPDWITGPLQIGHVFGERAAEWALSNGSNGSNGHARRGARPRDASDEALERALAPAGAAA